jgi:hypothetical protein
MFVTAIANLSVYVNSGAGERAPAPASTSEKPFQTELLKIAAEYKSWGRVDDQMRWAPGMCRTPRPGRAYVSDSNDEQTHGQKLYSLFARDRDEYYHSMPDKPVTVGQTIVKQSWIPEAATLPNDRSMYEIDRDKIIRTPPRSSDAPTAKPLREDDHFYPYARRGDKLFKASKQADLFIMLKMDPKTPGTDAGWVYGTVTPDGKIVSSGGKLESCMKCHQKAKPDRLFGLRW